MFDFLKDASVAMALVKLVEPVVSECLNDPNSWLNKKLGATKTAQLKKIVNYFATKSQNVDVDHEVAKLK